MDLKALLLEAKQKVPPVLQVLHCGDESMLDIGGDCRARGRRPAGWDRHAMKQVHTAHWWMGRGRGTRSGAWGLPCCHTDPYFPAPQASVAVPSAGAWAIGLPTARNSRRCRPSRSATSAARTTWPTAPWTSSRRCRSSPGGLHLCAPPAGPLDRKPASSAQQAWAGPGCVWLPALGTPGIDILASFCPLKHKLLESQP